MTAGISPAVAASDAEAQALFGQIEKVSPGLISESVENGSVSTSTVDAKAITVTAAVIGVQNFSWSFRATANHYDGYGSYISFNFKYLNNVPSLVVTATIAIDRGMYLNAVNSGAAQANWQEFVNRLNA